MLKKSAAARASRSLRHASMFCTTYPPPPGSAPGYHDAHQFNPTSAASVMSGSDQASDPLGMIDRISRALPNVTPAGAPNGCAAPTRDFSASMPPTAPTDTIARMIAPPISKMYWSPSVAATPQYPDTTV